MGRNILVMRRFTTATHTRASRPFSSVGPQCSLFLLTTVAVGISLWLYMQLEVMPPPSSTNNGIQQWKIDHIRVSEGQSKSKSTSTSTTAGSQFPFDPRQRAEMPVPTRKVSPSKLRLTKNETNAFNSSAAKSSWIDCQSYSSFQAIKRCHQHLHIRTNDRSCRKSIESWSDVQRCLNQYNAATLANFHDPLRMEINLVGERSTGSKFVVNQLKSCFPTKNFPRLIIHRDYTRPKHWFQRMDMDMAMGSINRLVIATFRDPYDWVAAMIENPYHAPNHFNGFDEHWKPVPILWEEFVGRPWSLSNRSQLDLDAFRPGEVVNCTKYAFRYHQVIPCIHPETTALPPAVQKAYFPHYELRRNTRAGSPGIPFKSILQLRADKAVNFLLEVPLIHTMGGFLAVRYEDLILQGTRPMLERVAQMLGLSELPTQCQPQGPEPKRWRKRPIPEGLRDWIDDHLDHATERLLDYPFRSNESERVVIANTG